MSSFESFGILKGLPGSCSITLIRLFLSEMWLLEINAGVSPGPHFSF